ncbi:MAG: NAD-dependent epimerase/dehydratase family protein [Candidatus Omnitrophota bacterium]
MELPFWKNKKVLITGGAGFVGSYVAEMLVAFGANVRVVDCVNKKEASNLKAVINNIEFLTLSLKDIHSCQKSCQGIEIVLNLAAKVGGISFNKAHPGNMFYENILINVNMLEAARLSNVERYLVTSSACVYSRHCSIPTPESEGFNDFPEAENDGYGWAKRMAEFQAEAYYREFNMKIAIARPYNTYGPRDCFDPEKSHVIPSLIKRIFDGENPLRVWGSGEQSRSFLYVTDLARGILEVAEKYPVCDPVNLGNDEEIKIKDLVKLIIKLSNRKIDFFFDTSKPDGQPRRNCDITKAKEKIGFEARIKLEEGIKSTIDWALNNSIIKKNE